MDLIAHNVPKPLRTVISTDSHSSLRMATGGARMGQIVKPFKAIQNRNDTETIFHRKD